MTKKLLNIRLTVGQFVVFLALEVTAVYAIAFAPLTFSPAFTVVMGAMGLLIFTVLSGDLHTVPRVFRERFRRKRRSEKDTLNELRMGGWD